MKNPSGTSLLGMITVTSDGIQWVSEVKGMTLAELARYLGYPAHYVPRYIDGAFRFVDPAEAPPAPDPGPDFGEDPEAAW